MSARLVLKDCRIPAVSALAGALAGHLLFHPYAMTVYFIRNLLEGEDTHFYLRDFLHIALSTFNPAMFPMASAFAFFGALIGLLLGIIVEKKRRLSLAEHENEKSKVALETLQRLMVTLSHHLLIANTVIGGAAHRCRKLAVKDELAGSLELIETQSKRIEAVVGALRKTTEIKTANYTSNGHELLIDISKEIEDMLKQKN